MNIKTICAFLFLISLATQVTALEVGDKAPDFSLQATDGKTYTLSQFKGKQAVVIAWFPKAYTKGCTIECKSLAENGHLLEKFNVTYFMASVDALEDNKGFAEEQNAKFPLLSDPSKQVAKDYDVLMPVIRLPKRHTFYIDTDGTILFIDRDVQPATSAEDMAAKLAELGVKRKEI